MFNYYGKEEPKSDREQHLEWELERAQDDIRRYQEDVEESRRQREEERRARWSYEERTANSWPEALQKQANLCWREYRQYPDEGEDSVDYFKLTATGCERAMEIWNEVESSKEEEIAELQRKIDAVRETIRSEVADKLVSENEKWGGIAQSMRDLNDEECGVWLDW